MSAVGNIYYKAAIARWLIANVEDWLRQVFSWQAGCKPNSVRPSGRGDHSSRPQVSLKLKQPTRKLRRAVADAASSITFPYLALLRVGFTKPIRFRIAGALLPHLFTLTARPTSLTAVSFLWHFPSLTSPRITRHTALRSSDFPPSTRRLTAIARLPAYLTILCS